MKTRTGFLLVLAALALSSCTGTRTISAGSEVDDVYYNKDDRRADQAAADQAKAQANAARVDQYSPVEPADEVIPSDGSYDRGLAAKNADVDYPSLNRDPYASDDYYYSRQVRRFNGSPTWNYYDPFYSYDPYYAIGTPTWNTAYVNRPWWYDPYFYNGPSYSWTYGWGQSNYGYFGQQSYWNSPWTYGNGWAFGAGYSPYGYGGYNGFGGFSPYGGYNYFGGGYGGGFGGYGYANGGFCGAPGYYGGGTNFGNGQSTTASNTVVAPRGGSSSLNTNGRPGNQPVLNPRAVRPYQGNPVVASPTTRPVKDLNIQSAQPTGNPSRNVGNTDRPVYNAPANTTNTRPVENNNTRPTQNYSRPVENNNSRPVQNNYSRPVENNTSRPVQNNYSRPVENNNSRPVQNNSRPKMDNNSSYTRPSNNNYSAPSNNNYSAPSARPSTSSPSPSPSRSTPSTGGGVSRPR